MNIQFEKNKPKEMLALVVLTIFFLLLNLFPFVKAIRTSIEIVFEPISFLGAKTGSNVIGNVKLLKDISKIKEESQGYKLRIQDLEGTLAGYTILLDKYNSLLKQSKMLDKKYEYVQAEMFRVNGEYLLNVGSDDGVKIGDVVIVGNAYFGQISFVDFTSSKITTPNKKGNSIPVIILNSPDLSLSLDKLNNLAVKNIGRAIATGNESSISVDNLASTSKAIDGDIVVIDDVNIGQHLVLGKLNVTKRDKADSLLLATVTPVLNVEDIKFVYVRK